MTNDKSIMSVAEAYKAMVNPPKAERPSWVPASIAEEKVQAFVEATKTARAEKQEIFEFEEKKYKISIKEELKGDQKKLDVNDNGEIDSEDLEKLRADKKVEEKLDPEADAGVWIKDFMDSEDPKFDGKSPEKRKEMALAAWYAARREAGIPTDESVNEATTEKAKEGPSEEDQEKLEPRAKGEKEFADAHEVEVKDGVPETSQDGSADLEEAEDNEPTDKSEKNNVEVALEPEEKAQTGAEKLNTAKQ